MRVSASPPGSSGGSDGAKFFAPTGLLRKKPFLARLRSARRRLLPRRRLLVLLSVCVFALLLRLINVLHGAHRDPFADLPRLPLGDAPAPPSSRRPPVVPSRIVLLVPSVLPTLPDILTSLSEAEYAPHRVALEVVLAPHGTGRGNPDVRAEATARVKWPHGDLVVRNASSGGRFDLVLDAWAPGRGENDRVVLLDAATTRLAPPTRGWFAALLQHASGGEAADAAGFALTPVKLRRAEAERNGVRYSDVDVPFGADDMDQDRFAYQTLNPAVSGVFVPANAEVWRAFRAWFAARRNEWFLWPVVVGAEDKKDPMWDDFRGTARAHWSLWFSRFCVEYSLYIIYPREPVWKTDGVPPVKYSVNQATRYASRVRKYDYRGSPVVRKLPISDGSLARIVDLAWRGGRGGIVSMTVVNEAFISTARSWICNVDAAGIRPPGIVWIATDEAARDAMEKVPDSETIFLSDFEGGRRGAGTSYGTPGYWLLMMERTRLIREILELGVGVFAFETDQIWLRDPVPHVKRLVYGGDDVDVVGTLDSRHEIGGNFLFLNPTLPTRRLWREVSVRFESSFRRSKLDGRSATSGKRVKWRYIENDQSLLTKLSLYDETLRSRGNAVVFRALDIDLFVDGRWYGEGKDSLAAPYHKNARARSPVLINNNFIIGIEKKMERAQRHGHWFLSGNDGECVPEKVHAAVAANEDRRRAAGIDSSDIVAGDVEAGIDFAIDAIEYERSRS